MRLSDAILLGLPEMTFSNGNWFYFKNDGTCEGCLVGTALYARGNKENGEAVGKFYEYWPWTRHIGWFPHCPVKGCPDSMTRYEGSLALTHLADHYIAKQLTGEQIADYIRSIEPAEPEEESDGLDPHDMQQETEMELEARDGRSDERD